MDFVDNLRELRIPRVLIRQVVARKRYQSVCLAADRQLDRIFARLAATDAELRHCHSPMLTPDTIRSGSAVENAEKRQFTIRIARLKARGRANGPPRHYH